MKLYDGEFFDGVSVKDTIDQVKAKIAAEPDDFETQTMLQLQYAFSDHIANFCFSKTWGGKMVLASIRLKQGEHKHRPLFE